MRVMALKTFRSGDRIRQPGDEFDTDAGRAREYERKGRAIPIGDFAPPPAPAPAEPVLQNEAAEAGPLASAGGETGAETPPSLSPAGPAPKKRPSSSRGGGRTSSSSTTAGA